MEQTKEKAKELETKETVKRIKQLSRDDRLMVQGFLAGLCARYQMETKKPA